MAARLHLAIGALLLASWAPLAAGEGLIVCGGSKVFIIPADSRKVGEKDRSWRWRAADSPEIPAEMHGQFRSTDECKPVGDAILITSSSGGVALIRRQDKKCLFYTSAKNAHSACLVPNERIAVASSHGGDELLLYDSKRSGMKVSPLGRLPLDGAHGVLWDSGRKRLWALGTKELLLIELAGQGNQLKLAVEKRWNLPTLGGHDLFPTKDPRFFFVTTNTHVYRFDRQKGRFEPFQPLAKQPKVKSVDQHPRTGQIVYHQGTDKTWWSDTIRFLDPPRNLQLSGERLYKVRWDVSGRNR